MTAFPKRRVRASPAPGGDARCQWCGKGPLADVRADYCSKRCRQSAFRLRRRRAAARERAEGRIEPMRVVYADPPYLGRCALYGHHHPDGRCWNDVQTHARLIENLEARRARGEIAGWALSCAEDSLRELLPLAPRDAHVCPWVKPKGVSSRARGPANAWEAVIVVGGRQLQPGVRDWLSAQPARSGGDLLGRKPLAFCAWIFDLLGMLPGDELEDPFLGTGIVTRAWANLSRVDPGDVSPRSSERRASLLARVREASLEAPGDASPTAVDDASPPHDDRAGPGASAGTEGAGPRAGTAHALAPRQQLTGGTMTTSDDAPSTRPLRMLAEQPALRPAPGGRMRPDASTGPRAGEVA